MNIEQTLVEKLRQLPADKQKEVLDFVEFLHHKNGTKHHHRPLKGLWAGFGVDISAEDIAEARRDMWGLFPREDIA